MNSKDKEGVKFLLKLYDKGLYNKKEVLHSSSFSDDKFVKVKKYLDRLESSNKVFSREKKGALNYLKNRYYDKYVIKKEDVSSFYLDKRKRLCFLRGAIYSKKREINKVIKFQKQSLDKWLDYLARDDISYPMWARYWAFQGMVRLGSYNYDRHLFGSRTKTTVAPFPKLSLEALDKAISLVTLYYEEQDVSDLEMENLVKQGNFGKIYARFLWEEEVKAKNNLKKEKEGVWKRYYKGSDYQKLVNDIYGKYTFWCIEDLDKAADYLSMDDIDIYFTKDEKGDYTVPRLAVVIEYGEIVEIRGISDTNQNVESEFLDIVSSKLEEIPHDKKFDLALEDMKYLRNILLKDKKSEELSLEDIRFLYEIDGRINFFGKDKDKGLLELLAKRDKKQDNLLIYGTDSYKRIRK